MLATDLYPLDKPDCVESLWPAVRMNDLLAASDVVILCVPLTSQTRGFIAAEQFAQMRRGAILINVARGEVVAESDLAAALASGHLAGAGLDVAEIEPLPPQSLLWQREDVIITPHVGAQSARRVDDTTDLICENLQRYLADRPLLHLVDKQLGFAPPAA